MDWGQVLTIIFGTAGFMGIFMLLMNKRIDDLRQDMDRRFQDVNNRFNDINRRLDKLEEDIKEIRQLLYKVLGAEIKKE